MNITNKIIQLSFLTENHKKIISAIEWSHLIRMSTDEIQALGVSPKAAQNLALCLAIAQAHKLGHGERTNLITSSSKAYQHLKHLGQSPIEVCHCIYMNRRNQIIANKQISIGGIASTVVDIKVILNHAVILKASSIILAHNHPSGNLRPSLADEQLTKKLAEAAKLFDTQLTDHLIITANAYYSFGDEGKL